MGHYVELRVECQLRADTPKPILAVIFFMANMDQELQDIIDRPTIDRLNETYRHSSRILNCNSLHISEFSKLTEPYCKIFQDPSNHNWVIDTVSNFKWNNNDSEQLFAMIAPFVIEKTNKPIGYQMSCDEYTKRYYRINKISHQLEPIYENRYYDTKGINGDHYLVKCLGLFDDSDGEILYEGTDFNEAFKTYNQTYDTKLEYNSLYVCNDYEKILYVCNTTFKNKNELKKALKPVVFY